jgi:hypothetical protein
MSIIHQCSVISVVEKHLVAALPRCGLCGDTCESYQYSFTCAGLRSGVPDVRTANRRAQSVLPFPTQ